MQDPMSEESDRALEEMEEIEAAQKDEQLLELAVHYIISGGEHAAEISKDKKRAVRRKASTLDVQKGEVFLKRHGRIVKVHDIAIAIYLYTYSACT